MTTNNFLSLLGNKDVGELSFDEMRTGVETLILSMTVRLQQELAEVNKAVTENTRRQTELELRTSQNIINTNNKVSEMERNTRMAMDMATSSNNVKQVADSYVNQTSLGSCFNVNVSSVRIGKLLKVVGIAQKSQRKTIPYMDKIPLCAKKRLSFDGHEYHVWNKKRCVEIIDKWLKDNDVAHAFYSIEHEKDLGLFIDDLYQKYVRGVNN